MVAEKGKHTANSQTQTQKSSKTKTTQTHKTNCATEKCCSHRNIAEAKNIQSEMEWDGKMAKTHKTPKEQQEKNAANSLNKTEEHQATRGRCTWGFSPVGLRPSLKTWAGCLDENVAFWDVKWKGAFSFCGCNLLKYYGRATYLHR